MRKFNLSLLVTFFLFIGLGQLRAQDYCAISSASTSYESIQKVELAGITNESGSDGYKDFTDIIIPLSNSAEHTLIVTVDPAQFSNDQIDAWIDWNKDGDFSEDERLDLPSAKVASLSFFVPAGTALGKTRMRIISRYSGGVSPCDKIDFGEAEDYTVEVVKGDPAAKFSVNQKEGDRTTEFIFTDASFGDNITAYEWNFGADATPATANTKGPHTVSYSTSGLKTVSLKITDTGKEYITTLTDLIKVVPGNGNLEKPSNFFAKARGNNVELSWTLASEKPKLVFPEDFESSVFPPVGWEVKTSDGINETLSDVKEGELHWAKTPTKSSEINSLDYFTAKIASKAKKHCWLVTPTFKLKENAKLNYHYYFKNNWGYFFGTMKVLIEVDGAWVELKTFTKGSENNEFKTPDSIDLGAYANKTVRVAFVKTKGDYFLGVDNIDVTNYEELAEASSSKSGETVTGFKIYKDDVEIDVVAADARSFVDASLANASYTYAISAVYGADQSYLVSTKAVVTHNPYFTVATDKKKIGVGEEVTYIPNIRGTLSSLEWTFGEDASPKASSVIGDVKVLYSKRGMKSVSAIMNNLADQELVLTDAVEVIRGNANSTPASNLVVTNNYEQVKLMWIAPQPKATETFEKYNIYRNDEFLVSVNDITKVEYEETINTSGDYEYEVTVLYAGDKESYPTNAGSAYVLNPEELPYSNNFENESKEWKAESGDYQWTLQKAADFDDIDLSGNKTKIYGISVKAANAGMITPRVFNILKGPRFNLKDKSLAKLSLKYKNLGYRLELLIKKKEDTEWTVLSALLKNDSWEDFSMYIPEEYYENNVQIGFKFDNQHAVSYGAGIDDISVETLEGKHFNLEFNEEVIASTGDLFLGRTEKDTKKEFRITIQNTGDKAVNLSELELSGDAFSLKEDVKGELAIRERKDIVVVFEPKEEKKDYTASLKLTTDGVEGNVALNLKADCGQVEWTHMVYLYEDGTDLNGARDFNELEAVGSIPGIINYVVLYDADDDYKDGIYYVKKDKEGVNRVLISEMISDHMNAGLDMNKWTTLSTFGKWVKNNYPAKKYGITVWDHGSGIFKSTVPQTKSAVGDMKFWELSQALEEIVAVDKKKIEFFGFDVCLAGQVESAYQLKDYVNYIAFSEKTEPEQGWLFNETFGPLNANPEMTTVDFIKNHTKVYAESYNKGGAQSTGTTVAVTQSGVSVQVLVNDFIPALNALAERLTKDIATAKKSVEAAFDASWYHVGDGAKYQEHRDLGHFLKLLIADGDLSDEIKTLAQTALDKYELAVVSSNTSNIASLKNVSGMKVWMPKNISENSNVAYYIDAENYLDFCETSWDELLYALEGRITYGAPVKENISWTCSSTEEFVGSAIRLDSKVIAYPTVSSIKWEITPATYEFVQGTSENSKAIYVQFNEAGKYSVSLTATNSIGTATNTIADQISINAPSFDAPKGLTAEVEGKNVKLQWAAPGSVLKIDEGFEASKELPEGWSVARSEAIDAAHTAVEAKDTWTIINKDVETTLKDYIHTGNQAAYINYIKANFNWLITPEAFIETGDKLNFWVYYKNGKTWGTWSGTDFYVMVFADGKWNQELFWSGEEGNSSENNLYDKEVSIALEKYVGKRIKISFVQKYINGRSIGIDDVAIKNANSAKKSTKGDGEPCSYKVYRNDVELAEITDVKDVSYTDENLADGEYTYKVTMIYKNPNGESEATNEAKVKIGEVTSVNEVTAESISIYPNPAKDYIIINSDNKIISAEIYNIIGELVLKPNLTEGNNIQLSSLKSGVYLLRVELEGLSKLYIQKIIKE